MTASPLTPVLTTARSYLEHALREKGIRRSGRFLAGAAIDYGLECLIRVTDELGAEIADRELAEVALVYNTLAEQVAELLGVPVPDAFRALVELCADEAALPLVREPPAVDPGLLELLRRHMVWITVTYHAWRPWPCRRVIEIVHSPPEGDVLSRKVSHVIGWKDLPEDVRQRILTRRRQAVRFQLYSMADSQG